MIDNLNRFVAYICAECSGISDTKINVFDFSGDIDIKLVCADKQCKCHSGTIAMKNDKMRISLKCPVCTSNHSFTISKNAFWSKDLITFDCTNAGIPIFFAGDEESVISAVNESEKMFDDFEGQEDLLPDELKLVLEIFDALHFVLEEHRMICKCGSRNLYPLFESDTMKVVCEDCGNQYPIKPSRELLNMLSRSKDDFKL